MSTSSQTIDLADFRERTAEQRKYESEESHTIVDYLPILSLEYEDRVLVVKYDFTQHQELYRRIRQNPAWGIIFFGVISDIFLGDLVVTVNVPDKIALQKDRTEGGGYREVIVVTFQTQTKNLGKRIAWDTEQVRKRSRPIYTFR